MKLYKRPSKSKPTLKQLKKQWYNKLKDDGFDDIEYAGGTMQVGHPRGIAIWDPFLRELTLDYYGMCTDFLNEYKFKNNLERAIWEYYTNGLSHREISTILKTLKTKSRIGKSHDSVWRLIKKLESEMKKKYL